MPNAKAKKDESIILKRQKMSYSVWLNKIKGADKTSIIQGRTRKIHYKFRDGQEMSEEYSLDTGMVCRRAWKKAIELKTTLGCGGSGINIANGCDEDDPTNEWTIEVGDTMRSLSRFNLDDFMVKKSITEPILSKRVTKKNLEWRIRNLPYPIEVYSVCPAMSPPATPTSSETIASSTQMTQPQATTVKPAIIVRTTNKKYYKYIPIPELERCELMPEQKYISFQHKLNTLIITYKKPDIVLEMEKAVLLELQNVETETDLDVNCDKLMQQLMGAVAETEEDTEDN